MLETIKNRLGVYYSTPLKDAEIQSMIDGAIIFMQGAGFPQSLIDAESPLAVEAIIIYCKMAQETDAEKMKMNPIFLSILAQARCLTIEV